MASKLTLGRFATAAFALSGALLLLFIIGMRPKSLTAQGIKAKLAVSVDCVAVSPTLENVEAWNILIKASKSNLSFLHQSWKSKKLPPRFLRWFSTWDICFPDHLHVLWTDEDNLNLIRTLEPDFLPYYTAYKNKIQRADSVRYVYMYYFGGIYSDLDNECLRSFQHLIEQSRCGVILSSMRYNKKGQYIQNSFFYSRPRHPFWRHVIKALRERRGLVGSHSQETVDITTGPQLLMHAVQKTQKLYAGTKSPGPICVFPDRYFNPYSWRLDKTGPCKDLNKMTESDLAMCKILHKWAYVLQYHTQSWFAGNM